MILHAEVTGAGPPLALLHGLFGRGRNLGLVARAAAPRWRVIALDLRNHGANPPAPGMEYATLAGDVIETLDALGALPAALLGHSMGGKAAMAASLLHPAQVSRLAVADIAPAAYAHGNAAIVAALRSLELHPGLTRAAADAALAAALHDAELRAFLLQNLELRPVPHWRLGLGEIGAAMSAIEGWPDALDAHRYAGPALFVRGGRSAYLLPSHEPHIRRLFPNARFATVPGAGHWLHAEDPAGFLAALGGFLDP